MSDTPVSPLYSWTCVACSRKVPNRYDVCRCGQSRDLGAEAWAGELGATGAMGPMGATGSNASQQPNSSVLTWLVLGFVAVAVAGTLVAIQVIPASPQPQAAAVVPEIAPAAPPVPETHVDVASNAPIESRTDRTYRTCRTCCRW